MGQLKDRMTTQTEALKLLVESLSLYETRSDGLVNKALAAGKKALAQPEQEPLTGGDERRHIICLCPDCTKTAQPEQEPDVYIPADALRQLKGTSLLILRSVPLYGYRGDGLTPLYTTPPQRKPLTDEQINEVLDSMKLLVPSRIARAIEAAHGIKGEA